MLWCPEVNAERNREMYILSGWLRIWEEIRKATPSVGRDAMCGCIGKGG